MADKPDELPENANAIIAAARSMYATDDIEIDDKPALSPGEGGCWVAAWVWVDNDFVED